MPAIRKTLTLALAGFGTVGGGLARALDENRDWLLERTGCDIRIKTILVRDTAKARDWPLPEGATLTTRPADLLASSPDVLVELMGGTDAAFTLVSEALAKGLPVVTANKALLAERGEAIFAAAQASGAPLLYEASVAGGIPIVQTLKESLAGNRIDSLIGILNGTANYILSEMTSNGLAFDTALKQAQELGFAEADPTLDIEGHDTAHKLAILIRLAFGVSFPLDELPVNGITQVEPVDIEFARELGYRIKLLAQVREVDGKLDAAVCPTLVNHTYLIARVGGSYNAVRLAGNAVGSIFLHGRGAGGLPTASAVLADVMSIARGCPLNNTGFVRQTLPRADVLSHDQAEHSYYVRVSVPDRPGVLRDLAGAMAEHDISIAQAIQKGRHKDGVYVVFMTHDAPTSAMNRAVERLARSGLIMDSAAVFRMLH